MSNLKIRKKLWNKGVRNCFWCKAQFKSQGESTLEHIIPLSEKGKKYSMKNLTLACKTCNSARKGENNPDKIKEIVDQIAENRKAKNTYKMSHSLKFEEILKSLKDKQKNQVHPLFGDLSNISIENIENEINNNLKIIELSKKYEN